MFSCEEHLVICLVDALLDVLLAVFRVELLESILFEFSVARTIVDSVLTVENGSNIPDAVRMSDDRHLIERIAGQR